METFFHTIIPPYGMPDAHGEIEIPDIPVSMGSPDGAVAPGPAGAGGPDSRGTHREPLAPMAEDLHASIYVEDGVINREKTASAFRSCAPGDMANLEIHHDIPELGGIYATGVASHLSLRDSRIALVGPGADDFSGVGAGIVCDHGSTMELRNVSIETAGIIRCCTTAMDHSILRVYDSILSSVGGNAPEDFRCRGPMCHPPKPLGITGDCRTHLTMNHSESYFYDSTILARSWGALSTDSSMGYVYLEANRCRIQTMEDGYCAYADGGCHDVFRECEVISAATGIIIAGDATAAFSGTRAHCRTNFAMIHSVMGCRPVISQLDISDCDIESRDTVILVKSANTAIAISDSRLTASNGVLIQSVINDDRDATKVLPGQKLYGVNIRLSDGSYTGDVLHEDTSRTMAVTIVNARLRGTVQNCYLCLQPGAAWYASGDSYVCFPDDFDLSQIDAPEGVQIHAMTGGSFVRPGVYTLESGGTLCLSTF